MQNIILIGGGIGSGKTYLSDIFVKNGFIKETFAHNLKKFCLEIMSEFFVGVTEEHVYGDFNIKNKPLIQTQSLSFINTIESFISSLKVPLDDKEKANIKQQIYNILTKPNVSPREIMQFIGTDVFRDLIDKDFNVKKLISRIKDTAYNIVIDDYRFPNEYELLNKKRCYNTVAVNINRKGVKKSKHSSENQELYFDININLAYNEQITNEHYRLIMEKLHDRNAT